MPATAPYWWQTAAFYQVYPASFQDSNGDGMGDLPGLISRLPYIADLGFDAIWISPFYPGPWNDCGYDISDYTGVHPAMGTMDDLRQLLATAHTLGLKVVVDMVLNHSSAQHPWFQASAGQPGSDKKDWYIWKKGRGRNGSKPPNNWRSLVTGNGWQTHPARPGEWYYASFLPWQPDLNWRHPALKAEMLAVVRHWMDAGADGMRLDIFNCIYKDAAFTPNPAAAALLPSEANPVGFFQEPKYTLNQPESIALAQELRQLLDSYGTGEKMMVGETVGTIAQVRPFVQQGPTNGLHLAFTFQTLGVPYSAAGWGKMITELEAAFPAPLLPVYVHGNHDRPRLATRHGRQATHLRLLAMLQLTARGVPFVYYGEELGMADAPLPPSRTAADGLSHYYAWVPGWLNRLLARHMHISLNRDGCRTPMLWQQAAPNAGFCPAAATPWLPVHATVPAADTQAADPASLLNLYRQLLHLRRQYPALHQGGMQLLAGTPAGVLGYSRSHGAQAISIYLNFGTKPKQLAASGQLLVSTDPARKPEPLGPALVLGPHEGVVLLHAHTPTAPPAPAAPAAYS